jgi:hypothetical protein
MTITALEESIDFAILDTEKLYSKLKSHELSHKGCLNHDANPTNTTISYVLEFSLSYLAAASDEKYESISDDKIALLTRKFRAFLKFRKERRRSPRGCFECGDTTHFNADCPKRMKLDSSNKYNYNNWNDYSKGNNNKKYHFRDKKKKKKF